MKKINKILLLLVISLLCMFSFPSSIFALTNQTNFIEIDSVENLRIGSLSFENILFKDYSSTSTRAFGISGILKNNSSDAIEYISTISYYDKKFTLIAEETVTNTAVIGTSKFNHMSNLSILNGHSIEEIYCYKLTVEVLEDDSLTDIIEKPNLTPSEDYRYNHYEYVIDNYDIDIIVNENNTFDITEKITAFFKVPKHGIFRNIPLSNTITRLDGTISKNRVQISNISVDHEFKKSKENGSVKLKIGSIDKTLTGKQTYTIKYNYNLGKDPSKNYDELYFNIIGNEWDTVIGNITFSIQMPKEFDSSKLGFSSGIKGSTDNSNVKYNVVENKIIGSYNGILGSGESLTVRCELPEGYFTDAKLNINKFEFVMFLSPVVFLIISVFLWYKYGRDELVVEVVEFYPPEGLNSLDVGFLYKGKVDNKDVTSLLIYLANKGYLEISDKKIDFNSEKVNLSENSKKYAEQKIIELQNKINEERNIDPNSKKIKYYQNMLDIYRNIDKPIDYEKYVRKSSIKSLNNKTKFFIRKLKDYDGVNLHEKWFMEGLFEYKREEVTDKILYNSFYTTNNKILNNANNKSNKNKVFEEKSFKKRKFIILMFILAYIFITIPLFVSYGKLEMLVGALIFPGIGFTVLLTTLFEKNPLSVKIFAVIWGLGFGGMPWYFIVLPIFIQDNFYLTIYIIGFICMIGMMICYTNLRKRTEYGTKMLGRIKGFKTFLETVEKEKLESLVMKNPNYFYDILPYTYVLGVSDKWIKKFETISLQSPDWYSTSNDFNFSSFEKFMNSTMSSAQNVMSSSPHSSSGGSSSGGSSSGGSSSGGGSGGGGGGSW